MTNSETSLAIIAYATARASGDSDLEEYAKARLPAEYTVFLEIRETADAEALEAFVKAMRSE